MKKVMSCVLAAVLCTACGERETGSSFVVRDSAGVRIVEHGRLADAVAFRLADPVYRIGWSGDDHEFGTVRGGVLLSDGRAAVIDAISNELVAIDRAGRIEAILGGPGQGPGEIGLPKSLFQLPGDTLVVEELSNIRISFFHGRDFVRSYPIDRGNPFALSGMGLQNRDLFLKTSSYSPFFDEPWFQASIVRHPLDSQQWDTVRQFDLASHIDQGQTVAPFRPSGRAGMTAGTILVGRTDRSQVEMLDLDGNTTQVIRWIQDPVELTDSAWAAYSEVVLTLSRGISQEDLLARLRTSRGAVAGPLPYFGELRGDSEGRVWIAEFSTDFRHPSFYRVFGPQGEWLGRVSMPPRTEILDIDANHVLAIQRDDFDVEAVVLFPLEPAS